MATDNKGNWYRPFLLVGSNAEPRGENLAYAFREFNLASGKSPTMDIKSRVLDTFQNQQDLQLMVLYVKEMAKHGKY